MALQTPLSALSVPGSQLGGPAQPAQKSRERINRENREIQKYVKRRQKTRDLRIPGRHFWSPEAKQHCAPPARAARMIAADQT